MVNEKSHKPGDIVDIAGTKFAVLDVKKNAAPDDADELFVLLCEPIESTVFSLFSSDGNDYTESKLREKTDLWFEEFSASLNKKLVFSREISLLTMDGRANYGIMHRLAAPLTSMNGASILVISRTARKVIGWQPVMAHRVATARRTRCTWSPMVIGAATAARSRMRCVRL